MDAWDAGDRAVGDDGGRARDHRGRRSRGGAGQPRRGRPPHQPGHPAGAGCAAPAYRGGQPGDRDPGVRGQRAPGRPGAVRPGGTGRGGQRGEPARPARRPPRPRRADPADPVRAGDRTAAQALISDTARSRFNLVRSDVGRLQDELNQLRADRVRAVDGSSSQLVELLVAAGLVILLAAILLAVLLRYLVTRPVYRLAAEVREVVRGDYEHVVSVEGPPELARLAGDVESMRRRIVNDLQEVGQARQLIEETNRQLESQAEELTRSNRDLEQFAYVASHDLQEPLRKVISFCQLLQRRYAGQLDERANQYIAFAVDGAERMQRLINDLLAFSRIGRLTSGFTDVDLDALVREAVNQREAALQETGGTVTWADLPTVRGEEPLLSSLLGNLISNSIKF